MNSKKIHHLAECGNLFIIAKTTCGKPWQDINEFSSDIKNVTCKVCLMCEGLNKFKFK